MAIQLNAGQKVRIGGLEFTVQNTETKVSNKQRITGIRLEAIESLEDVIPPIVSEVPTNVQEAIDSLTQVFKRWGISLEDFAK